jgi:hypothetical protein
MKHVRLFVSVLLLFAGPLSSLYAQPQYYNYNTNGSNNSFPFNIAGGKEVQLLYLPGDFNQPAPAPSGNITSVSFRIGDSYPLGPWTYTDFTIKMGQTSITSFVAGSFYAGTLTTVYYRASVSLSATGGSWLTITLDSPFPYDPTQSLVIDLGQCGVPGATGFSACFTTLTGNRRIWSVGGCPFAYSSYNSAIYHCGINLQTSGPPVVVTTAASAVTTTTATLNGTVNANGASTTVTFEYGLTTAYGTTVPGVPGTVTGNSVTPVSANITGLLPGNTYHFRTVGANSNGTTNGGDMTFTTTPILPAVVTTAATNVGATTATVNGTVNAGGASTSVTFEYGLTTAYGTTVPGVPATVTGNTDTPVTADLTGLAQVTTYHYRVNGANIVGNTSGLDQTFTTTNCPMPAPPGTITGPSSVCGFTGGNVYSVAPITFATGYNWTVPAGATISAGSNTNTITVTFGNTPGNVSVNGINSCGNGPGSSMAVTVLTAPVPTISGPNSMCVNSGYFAYTTEPGMTNYIWTVSSGGSIAYGQGTNQIQVTWGGSGAQTVTVNYTGPTGCAAVTPTSYPVNVSAMPGAAGTITGTATVCGGVSGIAYSVAPVAGATTYIWTLPAGATIASGELTNAILVDFATGAASGNITVYANNLCGNGATSPPFAVTVTPLPAASGSITGYASVCAGDLGVGYTVASIANATGYTWALPSGATIASGANTNSITVDFSASAASGDVTVFGTNSCGNGTISPAFPVTVNQVPPAPVITQNGDTLSSSAPAGNQWYFEGNPITGATGQTYVATQSGDYWCVVTLNGCSSDESNTINVVITGTDPVHAGNFSVRPVPNDGRFTVSMATPSLQVFTIQVFNCLGVVVSETGNIEVKGTVEKVIDLRPVENGVYTIVILGHDTRVVKKIVVNR